MAHDRPSVVSLFSGAGGLDIGLEQAGWHTVSATDKWHDSMETLRRSQAAKIKIPGQRRTYLQGTRLVEKDAHDLVRGDLVPSSADSSWQPDLLAGGPPCQPWSSAGSQRGLSDPRGRLIARMLSLVGELEPRYVLFENVRGLVTARGGGGRPGEVLRSIQDDLYDRFGYVSRIATINAADYGAAQRRVRLILLATKKHKLPDFPRPTHDRFADGLPRWVTLGEVLAGAPQPQPDEIVRPTGERAESLRALAPGKGLRTGGRVMNNRPGGHWGYRQDSFLADLALPSRTIRAASTPDWVRLDGEPDLRRLTWRECAILQGFPVEWAFDGAIGSRFTQVGNAVQTNVARAVGATIAVALRAGERETVDAMPEWPQYLRDRVRYTESEQRVNGHLRVRLRENAVA
jgi:DNA (cytosine-5)-methyltransferase 1